jgi:hypothetical protein
MKFSITLNLVFLMTAFGCSGPARQSTAQKPTTSWQNGTEVSSLNLSAIRFRLTHDLTHHEACTAFGTPWAPGRISGNVYETWMLDDGNRLNTAFSRDGGRLLRATVMSPDGQIIEHVLHDPKR